MLQQATTAIVSQSQLPYWQPSLPWPSQCAQLYQARIAYSATAVPHRQTATLSLSVLRARAPAAEDLLRRLNPPRPQRRAQHRQWSTLHSRSGVTYQDNKLGQLAVSLTPGFRRGQTMATVGRLKQPKAWALVLELEEEGQPGWLEGLPAGAFIATSLAAIVVLVLVEGGLCRLGLRLWR